jgi:hypothetical protein
VKLDQLIADYTQSVSSLKEMYSRGVSITATAEFQRRPELPRTRFEYSYFANGENLRCDTTDLATGKLEVRVASPERSFSLVREKGSATFTITQMDVPYVTQREKILNVARFASAPFAFLDREIDGWLKGTLPGERVSLLSARTIEGEGEDEVLRIEIQRQLDAGQRMLDSVVVIDLLERRAFAAKAISIADPTDTEGPLRYLVTYAQSIDSSPSDIPLVENVRVWKDAPTNDLLIEEYKIKAIDASAPMPVDEYFSLAAFGFGGALTGNGLPWYHNVGVLLTIAIIFVLLWLIALKRRAAGANM